MVNPTYYLSLIMAQPTNVELMQQMMPMLQRHQNLIDTVALSQGARGLKVDGLKMPTYSGRSEEYVQIFFAQVKQYIIARGTRWTS